jgi:hypothetical protein
MKRTTIFLSMLVTMLLSGVVSGQQKPITGYAPVNGLKMYYEIHGSGEPVVLLHGAFMAISGDWRVWIGELSKTRKVIAVEMQGHGRTADIKRDLTYENLADDVAGLLDYLKIPSADIIGHRSAAPESISRDAQVMVLGRHGYETAVQGKNGFVGIVERSWTAPIDGRRISRSFRTASDLGWSYPTLERMGKIAGKQLILVDGERKMIGTSGGALSQAEIQVSSNNDISAKWKSPYLVSYESKQPERKPTNRVRP